MVIFVNEPDNMDPTGDDPSSSGHGDGCVAADDLNSASVDELIVLLREPDHRADAINLLIQKRETFPEMALSLWNSSYTISILLKEVIDIYKLLTPSELTLKASTQVCNAIALLQAVASHEDTRMPFIKALIPMYLYPFFKMKENEKPFEQLRLTSLGLIGALVKDADPQVIHFLLERGMFSLCLQSIELGDEPSKRVAILIISKMLVQDEGLHYCCAFADRFYAVESVFRKMVETLSQKPHPPLLKHIIKGYLRLSEIPRGREALRRSFPTKLMSATLSNVLHEDSEIRRCVLQFYYNILGRNISPTEPFVWLFWRLLLIQRG